MNVIKLINLKQASVFYGLVFIIFLCKANALQAQDFYKDQRSAWLQKAQESQPALIETIKQPVSWLRL